MGNIDGTLDHSDSPNSVCLPAQLWPNVISTIRQCLGHVLCLLLFQHYHLLIWVYTQYGFILFLYCDVYQVFSGIYIDYLHYSLCLQKNEFQVEILEYNQLCMVDKRKKNNVRTRYGRRFVMYGLDNIRCRHWICLSFLQHTYAPAVIVHPYLALTMQFFINNINIHTQSHIVIVKLSSLADRYLSYIYVGKLRLQIPLAYI